MLKMFSTQLAGLFKRIHDQNEFSLEDGARLLAQAVAYDGAIYICGLREMAAVEAEACSGAEPLDFIKKWNGIQGVTGADRVILFSRFSNDIDAVAVAQSLVEHSIPFVAVCTNVTAAGMTGESDLADLTDLADVYIDLKLPTGLLPNDSGNRVGYPSAMAGLFVYHGLRFILEDFLADFE